MPYLFDVKAVDRVTLDDVWTNFAGAVLPAKASSVQRAEMRMAFFAGFHECLCFVRDVVPELSDEHAVATLERFAAELNAFHEKMARGAA